MHAIFQSLCATVMICATLVNIQTDRHTAISFRNDLYCVEWDVKPTQLNSQPSFDQLIWNAQPAEL